MDILTDYRITALTVRERELALRAERVRIAQERAEQSPVCPAPCTGAIGIPSTSH